MRAVLLIVVNRGCGAGPAACAAGSGAGLAPGILLHVRSHKWVRSSPNEPGRLQTGQELKAGQDTHLFEGRQVDGPGYCQLGSSFRALQKGMAAGRTGRRAGVMHQPPPEGSPLRLLSNSIAPWELLGTQSRF